MTTNSFPEVPDKPVLYDWLYQHTDKDVEMYRTLTKGHGAILECAVGTGRLAIPLAEAGHEVYGIDYSKDMLDIFNQKLESASPEIRERIHLYHEDMREFNLNKKFSFVFIPFGSFVYLLNIEDQKACLRCLADHLEDGGTMVIDVPTWVEAEDEKWLANDMVMRKEKQAVNPNTGDTTEQWSTFRFDHASQIMEQDRHYRTYSKDGMLLREQVVLWRSRFFFLGEFRLLLELCDLEITDLYGDFQLGPYNKNSEVAVCVIKKKEK